VFEAAMCITLQVDEVSCCVLGGSEPQSAEETCRKKTADAAASYVAVEEVSRRGRDSAF